MSWIRPVPVGIYSPGQVPSISVPFVSAPSIIFTGPGTFYGYSLIEGTGTKAFSGSFHDSLDASGKLLAAVGMGISAPYGQVIDEGVQVLTGIFLDMGAAMATFGALYFRPF